MKYDTKVMVASIDDTDTERELIDEVLELLKELDIVLGTHKINTEYGEYETKALR
jgi:hypothetical protein